MRRKKGIERRRGKIEHREKRGMDRNEMKERGGQKERGIFGTGCRGWVQGSQTKQKVFLSH